jgi:hypothetical protein
MVAAPPFIDTDAGKMAAIAGLALLMIQAYNARLWNLVLLNTFGILGYCYALYI